MIQSLADRVNVLPPESVASVYLEDIALCAAWLDSRSEDTELLSGYKKLRENFDHWTHTAVPQTPESEGSRQQPILRKLVTDLLRGQLKTLHRDELDVLYFAWGLTKRVENRAMFDRAMQMIDKHIDAIRSARETLPKQPDLPNVTARVGVFCCDELAAAPVHDAKTFAGLEIPIRGPIFMHKGDLKIIDSVPEDCTVVADGGEVCVNGPVFGKVAATNTCEILGNVTGVVVARRGFVRTGKVLNHAIVISKEGSVHCYETQSPQLVYGGNEVKVRHSVRGGEYLGRRVEFGVPVATGVVQVTELVKAPRFEASESGTLHLVLRKNLTCQDYGEKMSIAATRLLGSAIRYRQHIRGMQDLLAMTTRESEDYAMSLLLFLLGAENNQERIQQLQNLQIRAAYAEHLEAVVRSLLNVLEIRLGDQSSDNGLFDEKAGSADIRAILDEMERDLSTLASEGKIEPDLQSIREEITLLGRKVQARALTAEALLQHLVQLIAVLDSLTELRAIALEAIGALEKNVEKNAGRNAVLNKIRAGGSCIQMLDKLLIAGRGPTASDAFKKRISERHVKLMLRNIEHRKSRTKSYENSIKTAGEQIKGVRDKLWREHQISLPPYVLDGEGQSGARAEGAFEANVRLCAWKHLVDSGKPGDRGYVLTESSGEKEVCYMRKDSGAIVPEEIPASS